MVCNLPNTQLAGGPARLITLNDKQTISLYTFHIKAKNCSRSVNIPRPRSHGVARWRHLVCRGGTIQMLIPT